MFEQAFKNIDDVLWKEAGCITELDYTEQISWLLSLKYLDGLDEDRANIAALSGKRYAGKPGPRRKRRTARSTTPTLSPALTRSALSRVQAVEGEVGRELEVIE